MVRVPTLIALELVSKLKTTFVLPVPLVTVQVSPSGWVSTVTLYVFCADTVWSKVKVTSPGAVTSALVTLA